MNINLYQFISTNLLIHPIHVNWGILLRLSPVASHLHNAETCHCHLGLLDDAGADGPRPRGSLQRFVWWTSGFCVDRGQATRRALCADARRRVFFLSWGGN